MLRALRACREYATVIIPFIDMVGDLTRFSESLKRSLEEAGVTGVHRSSAERPAPALPEVCSKEGGPELVHAPMGGDVEADRLAGALSMVYMCSHSEARCIQPAVMCMRKPATDRN